MTITFWKIPRVCTNVTVGWGCTSGIAHIHDLSFCFVFQVGPKCCLSLVSSVCARSPRQIFNINVFKLGDDSQVTNSLPCSGAHIKHGRVRQFYSSQLVTAYWFEWTVLTLGIHEKDMCWFLPLFSCCFLLLLVPLRVFYFVLFCHLQDLKDAVKFGSLGDPPQE